MSEKEETIPVSVTITYTYQAIPSHYKDLTSGEPVTAERILDIDAADPNLLMEWAADGKNLTIILVSGGVNRTAVKNGVWSESLSCEEAE